MAHAFVIDLHCVSIWLFYSLSHNTVYITSCSSVLSAPLSSCSMSVWNTSLLSRTYEPQIFLSQHVFHTVPQLNPVTVQLQLASLRKHLNNFSLRARIWLDKCHSRMTWKLDFCMVIGWIFKSQNHFEKNAPEQPFVWLRNDKANSYFYVYCTNGSSFVQFSYRHRFSLCSLLDHWFRGE